jgi:hypothetical protein
MFYRNLATGILYLRRFIESPDIIVSYNHLQQVTLMEIFVQMYKVERRLTNLYSDCSTKWFTDTNEALGTYESLYRNTLTKLEQEISALIATLKDKYEADHSLVILNNLQEQILAPFLEWIKHEIAYDNQYQRYKYLFEIMFAPVLLCVENTRCVYQPFFQAIDPFIGCSETKGLCSTHAIAVAQASNRPYEDWRFLFSDVFYIGQQDTFYIEDNFLTKEWRIIARGREFYAPPGKATITDSIRRMLELLQPNMPYQILVDRDHATNIMQLPDGRIKFSDPNFGTLIVDNKEDFIYIYVIAISCYTRSKYDYSSPSVDLCSLKAPFIPENIGLTEDACSLDSPVITKPQVGSLLKLQSIFQHFEMLLKEHGKHGCNSLNNIRKEFLSFVSWLIDLETDSNVLQKMKEFIENIIKQKNLLICQHISSWDFFGFFSDSNLTSALLTRFDEKIKWAVSDSNARPTG